MTYTEPRGSDAEIVALLRACGMDEANLGSGVRRVRELLEEKEAAARDTELLDLDAIEADIAKYNPDPKRGSLTWHLEALIAEVRRLREENVSTVAEIEELPMGSVVVDVQGDPWQRLGHGWQIAGDSKTAPAEFLSKLAPLRVVARLEEDDA